MEQTLLMNHAGLQSLDSQIGVHTEDGFIIDDDCCLGKYIIVIIVGWVGRPGVPVSRTFY